MEDDDSHLGHREVMFAVLAEQIETVGPHLVSMALPWRRIARCPRAREAPRYRRTEIKSEAKHLKPPVFPFMVCA